LEFRLFRARATVAFCLKRKETPSIKMWTKKLLECVDLERLAYISKGRRRDFEQVYD